MKLSDLKEGDYHPFYGPYIAALGDAPLVSLMEKQLNNFPQFLNSIPQDKLQFRYAAEKWSVLEMLVHVLDAERVFQYRALRIARGDQTPLPGFEQNDYVPESGASSRSLKSIVEEYQIIRRSTLALYQNFSEDILRRTGVASGAKVSVGALGFIICGHQKHHRDVLRARYL